MNIYVKNVTVALSILTFCFLLTNNSAPAFSYGGSSTQLGSRHEADAAEQSLDSNMAQIIADYSTVAGYVPYNWYGVDTTGSTIDLAAAGVGSNYSIAFYIGHGDSELVLHGPSLDNQYFIPDDDGNKVYDDAIFPNSGSSHNQLVFLWSCKQGDEIGGVHGSGHQYGMPYAWLHDYSISGDGYNYSSDGSQVFLGFSGGAPQFTDPVMGDHMITFCQSFYFALLCLGNGKTVNTALDYASKQTYQVSRFDQTELYNGYWSSEGTGHMKVYGNGNIRVSNAKPTCGLKTQVQGAFYVPNGKSFLKVEKLFDNGTLTNDLTRDQKGSSNPYGSFVNIFYPNGKVNVEDIFFVNLHFGQEEGFPGWDYMADINGDKRVNLVDVFTVRLHVNAEGTYIDNRIFLDRVRVVFGAGPEASLDRNGCVPIPQGAANFTVTLDSSPEGAMVIFW